MFGAQSNFLADKRWVPCRNMFTEDIPPYACMALVDTDMVNGAYLVTQPTDGSCGQGYMFASHQGIKKGDIGAGTQDFPARALWDHRTGTPIDGNSWCAQPSSWYLGKGKTVSISGFELTMRGFGVIGIVSGHTPGDTDPSLNDTMDVDAWSAGTPEQPTTCPPNSCTGDSCWEWQLPCTCDPWNPSCPGGPGTNRIGAVGGWRLTVNRCVGWPGYACYPIAPNFPGSRQCETAQGSCACVICESIYDICYCGGGCCPCQCGDGGCPCSCQGCCGGGGGQIVCTGGCSWRYVVGIGWVQTNSTCKNGCVCGPPPGVPCPTCDLTAVTLCSGPTSSTTSSTTTTCIPSTSTTPPCVCFPLCGYCLWTYSVGAGGWLLGTSTCTGTCTCFSPPFIGTDGQPGYSDCLNTTTSSTTSTSSTSSTSTTTTTGTCPPTTTPPPPVGVCGNCTWFCNNYGVLYGSCDPSVQWCPGDSSACGPPASCACPYPTVPICPQCAAGLVTFSATTHVTCVSPTSTSSTTTTNTSSTTSTTGACGGPCHWLCQQTSPGNYQWAFITGFCGAGSGCACDNPNFVLGYPTCDAAHVTNALSTLCSTSTTTSTTSSTSTTSHVPCGACSWVCANNLGIYSWMPTFVGCTGACSCVAPGGCDAAHVGNTTTTNCA